MALMCPAQKRDGTCKGRMVCDGKPTRNWIGKEDTASPTALSESLFLTATINAKENRDAMTADAPNAFTQASPDLDKGDRVTMKITGALVDSLVNKCPDAHGGHVACKNGKLTSHVVALKVTHGMLTSAPVWCRKFKGDLEGHGFCFQST